MADPDDPVRPTVNDVFDFRKIATVFCDVVSNVHAASMWGRQIDAAVLSMITELATPYIVSPVIYRARCASDVDAYLPYPYSDVDALLPYFEQEHREHQWWWGNMDDKHALVDMVALDFGPRIFAGGIASQNYGVHGEPQCSQVFKYDEHGVPTWYVLVVQFRGSIRNKVCFDLMVHADTTFTGILSFICEMFGMPQVDSTVQYVMPLLFVWGFDAEGDVDVEGLDYVLHPYSCFILDPRNTSALANRRFADVFVQMQEVAARVQEQLLHVEEEEFEPQHESDAMLQLQVGLWD